ncbi:N-acetyltransferase [Corynebacterium sp. sy017]|uniref:GNAT family N-acetyltransferase n=1 Tax=unclassified Corynebacterium TaxID=2624378 RepID=UPI0011860062|nr:MULTISPECIES: GNAT family protein [unclassified Corynebacterium]MBP3088177.1 N-acetyltransferase [Corynebacterium sp. sy017]QDZ43106.1 GNAT family N-acetyltransferase [Corynebacterium sp. sy039]TSD92680.1 N-acetyltransferase [Corynebacterium sp. SY003]
MSSMNSWTVPVSVLNDGDLILRPLRSADADAVFQCCTDTRMRAFISLPDPYTVEHARDYVESPALRWALSDPEDNYLGSIELRVLDEQARRVDVGYNTAPWARGRGLQTRALKLVLAHAFAHGVHRVEIYCRVDNQASRHVAEQAGAELEGILRQHNYHNGSYYDMALYALINPGAV